MAVAGRMIAKAPVTWPRDQSVTPQATCHLATMCTPQPVSKTPLCLLWLLAYC